MRHERFQLIVLLFFQHSGLEIYKTNEPDGRDEGSTITEQFTYPAVGNVSLIFVQ